MCLLPSLGILSVKGDADTISETQVVAQVSLSAMAAHPPEAWGEGTLIG